MRRAAILFLVSGVLATSGCCGGWVHRPFGPGTLCDPTNCGGPPCGPTCGPACGPVCGDPCGDPCGGPPCGPPGCGPFAYRHPVLAAILHPFRWGGCGEIYLGDFHSEPPDCCDPCDNCGNWTGGGWAGPAPVAGYGPPAAPAAAPCPDCGAVHAPAQATNGYVSSQSAPVITQAGHVVPPGATRR